MSKYHGIVTDSGEEFTVGLLSVEVVEDEIVRGAETGRVLVYVKHQGRSGVLKAAIPSTKIEQFIYV